MTPQELEQIIQREIAENHGALSIPGANLNASLVTPYKIQATNRIVKDGQIFNDLEEVWVVWEETPGEVIGYKIYYDESVYEFGLLSNGLASDQYPIILGAYGSFLETLRSM
jgi:hypothetical protein